MEIKELEGLITQKKSEIHLLETEKDELLINLGTELSSIPKKDIKKPELKEIAQNIDQYSKDLKAIDTLIENINKKKDEISTIDEDLKEIRKNIDDKNLILKEKQDLVGREMHDIIIQNPEFSDYKDLYADFENIQKEIIELQEKLRIIEEEDKGFFKKLKEGVNAMIIKNNIKSKEKEKTNLYPIIGGNIIQSDFFEKLNQEEFKDLKELIIATKKELNKLQKNEKDNIMLKEKKFDDLNKLTEHTQPDAYINTKKEEIDRINKSLSDLYREAGGMIISDNLKDLSQKKDFTEVYSSVEKNQKNIENNKKEMEKINFAIEYINKDKVLQELKNKEDRVKKIIEQNNQELKTIQDQIADTSKQLEISKKSAGNYIEK